MPEEQDLIKLYSGQILALAAAIPRTERLSVPDATVRKRSPLCGSSVTVDLEIRNGVITDFGQDVKACALGQAAASVVAANAVGRTLAEIQTARQALKLMLTQDGPVPGAPFDSLQVLLPAKNYKNRHASIMLVLDATAEAFEMVENSACA